jgi:hypothetical protein
MPPTSARAKSHNGASTEAVSQVLLRWLPLAKLDDARGSHPDGSFFVGHAHEVASTYQGLLKDIVDLDPFVTKSVLVQSLQAYTNTLGLNVKDEEWYKKQVYDLRQGVSHIRIKAVRVKTGARQAACVQDLVNVFQYRRLLKKTSSEPTPPRGATTEGLTSPLSSSTSSESVVASRITADSSSESSRCQQGRPARTMSKAEVWALYGLRAVTKCAEKELVDLSSSEDEVQRCEALVPIGSSGIAPTATTTTQPTSELTSHKVHKQTTL